GDVCRTPLTAERREAETRYSSNASSAAKQLSSAEGHLNKLAVDPALTEAEAALKDFRHSSDAVGCAESVRVISKAQQIKAFLSDDEDARSLQPEVMVTQELEKAKASSDRAAQAILYLALCEILSFGTADKGAPSRAMRDKALEAGNEAADLFQGLAETRMQA
ncbi:unnamed protein product, partial [Effrenium voratum]